jgi:hypothetical protein
VSTFDAVWNLGLKARRRLESAHKPIVRMRRRSARAQEQRGFRREAAVAEREIAHVASGSAPIIAGPWLAEVGYEVLYWIPFLRWFQDAYGVPRNRLVVLSRGGMEAAYGDLAASYVDIFDVTTPEVMAARNAQRQQISEGGGQKQSSAGAFDNELIAAARARLGRADAAVCHPSLMFRLFRHVWHGNLPFDWLWRRTRYRTIDRPGAVASRGTLSLPGDFIAAKLYAGPALTRTDATRETVRALVAQAAQAAPVIVLDTDFGIDEHRDFDLRGIPGVTSARALMTARTNLGVQMEIIARSRYFLGTCGGLAWLAPFLGVPTVAVYDDDRLLAQHLFVARQAGALSGAAEFAPLDLRGLTRAFSRPSP